MAHSDLDLITGPRHGRREVGPDAGAARRGRNAVVLGGTSLILPILLPWHLPLAIAWLTLAMLHAAWLIRKS